MRNKVIWVLTCVMLVIGLLLSACATTPSEAKVLKIGQIDALGFSLALDALHGVEIDLDKINGEGGLKIGGDRYKVEVITFDCKFDEALSKTGAQKLIFQDGVKHIFSEQWNDSVIPVAEENKVLFIASPPTDKIYDPALRYCFVGTVGQTDFPMIIPWMAKRFPEIKTVVNILPDRSDGHAAGEFQGAAMKGSGWTLVENLFYASGQTDLSAIGTKVKQLNPDALTCYGDPNTDSVAFKAAHSAGWRGKQFINACTPGQTLLGIAGADVLQDYWSLAWPMEFDPPFTKAGKEFKDAWSAKYQAWDTPGKVPECVSMNHWFVMKTAMQKANSLDPDKMAAVLANGMTYNSPLGPGKMVARPDKGNNRTVETVLGDIGVKSIIDGKTTLIEVLDWDQCYDLVATMYGWPRK